MEWKIDSSEEASDSLMLGKEIVLVRESSDSKWKLESYTYSGNRGAATAQGEGSVTTKIVGSDGFIAFGTTKSQIIIADGKGAKLLSVLEVPEGIPADIALVGGKLIVNTANGWVMSFEP
jgi:hypothetical protein